MSDDVSMRAMAMGPGWIAPGFTSLTDGPVDPGRLAQMFRGQPGGAGAYSSYAPGLSSSGASYPSSGERDLSRGVFVPGNNDRVGEFLRAIPKVRGRPVQALENGTDSLLVTVVSASTAATPANAGYGPDDDINDGVSTFNADLTYSLSRLGYRVIAPRIDTAATALSTPMNTLDSRLRAATADALRALDEMLATGDKSAAIAFDGLGEVAADLGRSFDAGTNLLFNVAAAANHALVSINPTGRGEGEGADCLMGGRYVLRALMNSPAGSTGTSGFRFDPRVGRLVYHYMGVPFYRIFDANDLQPGDAAPETGSLYAANLGPTGLCLVHAYGDAESFGLQVDEEPAIQKGVSRALYVHGAYALVAWEAEAVVRISDVPLSA